MTRKKREQKKAQQFPLGFSFVGVCVLCVFVCGNILDISDRDEYG